MAAGTESRGAGDSLSERLSERLAERLAVEEQARAPVQAGDQGAGRALLRVLSTISRSVAAGLQGDPSEVGRVDAFGMDEGWRARVRHFLELLYAFYWRVEVTGLENVPESGRAVLVANHSGGLPFDAFMISHAVERDHPAHRRVRPLLEDVFSTPAYSSVLMSRYGIVRACQENGRRLLDDDQLICVFPEGVKGVGKRYRERYQLLRFGRGGFIRLARRAGSRILPVSVVGAEETYPIIARPDWLSRRLGVTLPPITATFPLLGPLGMIPLPSKWWIDFGEPMDLADMGVVSEDDDIAVNRAKEHVRARIQWMIIERLKRRRSIWRD